MRFFSSTLWASTFNLAVLTISGGLWAANDSPAITLHLEQSGAAMSPMFYGLMTEEINHSYDGGLYGELIQNRIFRDDDKNPVHWSIVPASGAGGTISLVNDQPVEGTALTTCLQLKVDKASPGQGVGISNDGFWGIPIKPNTTYTASFYAKSSEGSSGPLTVRIENNDETKIFATSQISQVSGEWKKYSTTLTTGGDVPASNSNRFVISMEKPGTIWFNLVSLFPPTFNNRPNGNRTDLMQLLVDLKPAFLRCPGGNYLEGDTIATRFPWKTSLHDLAQRPGHMGCWSYRSSDGLGLLEFLEWAEEMHAQPVLAVYAGYSLKGEYAKPGPDLQPFVDEALDEIEYVTGDASTKWGAARVNDGHAAPFPVTYVEVGNEDQYDKSHSYDGRFAQFYDAIKAKYPQLQIIATTKVTSRKPDVVDEHFYRSTDALEGDANHYNGTSRTGPKIFCGEWATRTGPGGKTSGIPTPDMEWTLADAAWLTGLERNSDVVVMQCYAPLLTNVNHGALQWKPDLIGYDGNSSYGSPSYYMQKMFSQNHGDTVVPIDSTNIPMRSLPPPASKQIPTLFFVATMDKAKGTVYLKVVNTAQTPQALTLNISGPANIAPDGVLTSLSSAAADDTNTISDPTKIVPVSEKVSGLASAFSRTFPAYSVNVLQIETR